MCVCIVSEGFNTVIVEPAEQPVYADLGSTLDLTCIQKNGAGVSWYHNDTLIHDHSEKTIIETEITPKNEWQSILQRENMTYSDSGTYRCHPVNYHENLGYSLSVYVKERSMWQTQSERC